MSKNPNKTNQKKMKRSLSFYLIIISLFILAIPVTFLAITGITSLRERGKPVIGNRFANDQDPKISDQQVAELLEKIKAQDHVDQATLNLVTGTLRVYVLDESVTNDNLEAKGAKIYNVVDNVLSVEEYFTKSGAKKQYDLEIYIFNLDKVNEENENNYVYGMYVKNANMEKPYSQILTTPLSEDMVKFFLEEEAYNSRPIEEELNEEGTINEDEGGE